MILFITGAIYTRLWHKALPASSIVPPANRPILKAPSWRGVSLGVKDVVQKFLVEAMPIFLIICVIGGFLNHIGFLNTLAIAIAPLMTFFGLPGEVAHCAEGWLVGT